MSEEKEQYQATGSFANNSISGFKRYVKDGKLDVEAVTKDYALNERQIPRLTAELEAAGYLQAAPAKTTRPLPKIEKIEEPA